MSLKTKITNITFAIEILLGKLDHGQIAETTNNQRNYQGIFFF
jgi:hypothetical protein